MVSAIFLAYNIAILAVLLVLLSICVYNLLNFTSMARPPREFANNATAVPKESDTLPYVSILVPARNEQRGIDTCVRSLCLQEYPGFEVIVLDDGSTDATPVILEHLQEEFPSLRVVQGKPLPSGWVGKSWACHQLSQAAIGTVFIFTDADTVHAPDMISSAVATLNADQLDFFSAITDQMFGSFGEHVVIPMVHLLYFAYVPNRLITTNPRTSLSAANGQFMCFRRTAYEAVGGHCAVQNALVEDVFLARIMKQSGYRIALVDGTNFVSCRMYTSASQVTAGFSKNFFPGTGYNLPITVVFLVHLATAYVLPVAFLASSFWPLALAQLSVAALMRLLISIRFGMPAWHALVQPITAAWSIFIGINSIRWAYSSLGSTWKGRSYQAPFRNVQSNEAIPRERSDA